MGAEWLIALTAIPLLGAMAAVVWPRRVAALGLLTSVLTLWAAWQGAAQVWAHGPIRHLVGGWEVGLAITLRLDALAIPFVLLNVVVFLAAGVYATAYFTPAAARRFWPIWLLLLAALNALLVADDFFHMYVALELIGLSAVGLTALGHGREALQASLRYLLVGLIASLLYLGGVAVAYLHFGTLDIGVFKALLDEAGDAGKTPAAMVLALMSAGLMLKAALFPLHFWLPPAHAAAPAPVSAALSALVVKAAWYWMLRLWLETFEGAVSDAALSVLAALAAAGVLWGGWRALRALRLKHAAAYSSVAQLGYLFLAIPLLLALPPGESRQALLAAVVVFALAHGLAKAALFLAAGLVLQKAGHDDIRRLEGTVQSLPLTAFTLALAGVSLIGLPPSGGFLGKWFLLEAAIATERWWLLPVFLGGALLAGAYVFRIIRYAFGNAVNPRRMVTLAWEEWPALLLALGATVGLGLGSAPMWVLLAGGGG